jgi:hypothetical protein
MPRKAVPVRVNGSPASRKPATSPQLARLLNEYDSATVQYGVIVRYLKAAIEILPKAECQLLLEFAERTQKAL